MSNKRKSATSISGTKEIFDGASVILDPPLNIHLGEGVRPYWDKLVNSKATRGWTDPDLLLLVELSRNLYRTERLSADMLTASATVETQSGEKANPIFGIVDQLVKRARLIMTTLQIHTEATQGKANKQVKQNEVHNNAKTSTAKTKEESLLASPTAH